MTDLFQQQGITFESAPMASTHPTATPAPISAPKIDMDNAPGGPAIPQDDASELQPPAGPMQRQRGVTVPPPPAPQQISEALQGSGDAETGAVGAAPPQPSANSNGVDLLEQEGISAPAPFTRGVSVAPGTVRTPEDEQVAQYAQQQHAESAQLAVQRFTPEQLQGFANNPLSMTEAMKQQSDWPDVPILMKKMQEGQDLNDAQKNRLNDYIDATLSTNMRGLSWDGKTAVVAKSLPAQLQDYVNSGQSGPNGDMAAPTTTPVIKPNSIMPAPYSPKPGEKPLNDFSAVTDKGQQIMASADEKPASTAMKLAQFVQLPVGVAYALYDAYIAHNPYGHITDLNTPDGYHKAIDDAGEQVVAQMLKAYTPMTYAEHANAQWTGEILPLSGDEHGNIRLDFRAGLPGMAAVPGDVLEGNIPPEQIPEEGRAMAENLAMVKFGEEFGARRGGAKAAPAEQQGPSVDDYLQHIASSPDQSMVKAGAVSIDGAKSDASVAAEAILQQRGVAPAQAQEVVSNLTATEKDNFVQRNNPQPTSPAPTLADTSPEALLRAQKAPQGPNTAQNIIAQATNSANAANPPPISAAQSGFNAVFENMRKGYSEMWNDLQPIENLGTKAREAGAPLTQSELSPASLSLAKSTPALVERQLTTGTTTWDAAGNQVVTGRGLKQIRDDFDNTFKQAEPNRQVRQDDLDAFENAMTFIEDHTKNLGPVSPKDLAESRATLDRLNDKYGDKMKLFESFAKQEVDYDNRILHNLVTSGLKTQAWYDETTTRRQWYSSTARVIEQEFPDDALRLSKNLGTDVNPQNIGALKQRKGSELEVMDKTQSRIRNTAIIMRRSMLNKVRGDVAKYAAYYPEQVQVKPPQIIRAEVQHSYDPKLRTKLEKLVDFLGGQVKRDTADGVKSPQLRGALGAYEPATKSVFLKPGTTEGTLTHEAGHMLDQILDLKTKLLGQEGIKGELEKLAEDRLRSRIDLEQTPEGKTEFKEAFERNPQKYIDYVKNPDEIIANFFDAWVNSPEQVERIAPTAKALFEKSIEENPQLAMLKQIEPSTQRAMETIQKALLDFKGPKDSLPVYINGKLNFLHMDPELARAFKGLDQVQATMVGNFIGKVGRAQAHALQFGATNNPYFIARHFLRGAQSSFVNTPIKAGPIGFLRHFALEIPKGMAAVIGKTDAYREWASSSGALRTYMDISDKGVAKIHKDIFETGDYGKFLNPKNWAGLAKDGLLNGWQTAKQVSDYSPRIAAYERMKAKGYSDIEAGYLSLEATGNYIRHGSFGKEVNAFSPFFNDRLQGADRFLRAIKRDPAGYSLRAMALITMPQLLISGYYLFAADDQTRKEYLNLNDFRRSAAMNIKIDGQWIPFPRAFAPGFVFGALPEFAMIHFSGIAHPELKNFWLHMIGDTINSLSPSTDWTQTIPPLIKAAIESKANYSFFRDQPIFHGDINKTAPENQFNSTTSESAKELGKLFGISPAKIDNTAYDMAAHIGVYAQQLGDYAINTSKRMAGQPVNERPTRGSDNPLYGPMMQPAPVGTAGESFKEFNEHMTDLAQQHNRDKDLTGPDKSQFERDNHQDLAAYGPLNSANNRIHNIEKDIRQITQNPHMTGDEKAQAIAQKQTLIQVQVDAANKIYHSIKGQ